MEKLKPDKQSETLFLALRMLSYKQAHAINYYAFIPTYNYNILSIDKTSPHFYFDKGMYNIDENSLEQCIHFLDLEWD